MHKIFTIFILFVQSLCVAQAVNFDAVVVGSSPIPLLEALYRAHSGEKVCIIEESERCGGAWKSISICGVPYADMGCHQIGSDTTVRSFLEEYIGCKMVALDYPANEFTKGGQIGSNGYYPSKGCHELIENILKLIQATDIVLLTKQKLHSVNIDDDNNIATLKTTDYQLTTSKIIVTPATYLYIENHPSGRIPSQSKIKYYHVYLLIEDATLPRFVYRYGAGAGITRLMNLSYFSDLIGSGMQLIAIQTHNEYYLSHAEEFFEQLKKNQLIDEDAILLRTENCIYEQSHLDSSLINQYKSTLIEVLNTGHFLAMSGYVAKWKQVLKPYKEICLESNHCK